MYFLLFDSIIRVDKSKSNFIPLFVVNLNTFRSTDPILMPELRIQFGDFSYLHYSILSTLLPILFYRLDPLHFGDLLRMKLRTAAKLQRGLLRVFKIRGEDRTTATVFQTISSYLNIPSNAYAKKKTASGSRSF